MEGQGKAIIELWRMFLRQFWTIAIISAVGFVMTAIVAFILPPIYESQARILVESQQIPDELARSTVTSGAAERLQLIQQRLMTRENLLNVITEQGLFENRRDLTLSDKINELRDATSIRPIALTRAVRARADRQISAFVLSVRFEDPQKASVIANEFVSTILNQNARARSQRASETLKYFVEEQDRLSNSLTDVENRIMTYKRENENALPDSLDYRRTELTRLADSEFKLDQRILELEEDRSALEIQLNQLLDAPETVPTAQLSAEEQGLRRLELILAQKRAVYAESHREIRALKAQISALSATLPTGDTDSETAAADARGVALAAAIAKVQKQIELLDNQIELVVDQKTAMADRRESLEKSILQTPDIEMRLNALNREYEDLQEQYDVSVRKRAQAETGEKLEINQQAERFEVIENALVPERPVAPDRRRILMLGSVVSLAIAGGVAFLFELLNPAMRTAAAMERALDLRPVATIPYIRTRRERRIGRLRIVVLAAIVLIGTPLALFMVDTYYLPLQLLAERFIEQAGLREVVRIIESQF